ncbi:MAG TPA: hypothetical protein VGG13_01575 [Candidatus Saccharimonadales bacterium]|jgi:DNA-directed RNA polymerase specialized sigma subunit
MSIALTGALDPQEHIPPLEHLAGEIVVDGLAHFLQASKQYAELGGTSEAVESYFDNMAAARRVLGDDESSVDRESATLMEQSAREGIVKYYLLHTTYKAYRVWDRGQRRGHDLSLDDLIQSSCVGLLDAVDHYADSPKEDRKGFTAYADVYVNSAIHDERLYQLLRKRIAGGQTRQQLREYWKAQNAIEQEQQGSASLRQIAGFMQLEVSEVMDLASFSGVDTTFSDIVAMQDGSGDGEFLDRFLHGHSVEPVVASPAQRASLGKVASQALLERSLELLTLGQQDVIVHKYGLDGGPEMSTKDIAQNYGWTVRTAQNMVTLAMTGLKQIMPSLASKQLDLASWATAHPNRKNALTFLASIGVDIPDDMPLSEVRELARTKVEQADLADRDKAVTIGLYGLGAERAKAASEVAHDHGLKGSSSASTVGKRVVSYLASKILIEHFS